MGMVIEMRSSQRISLIAWLLVLLFMAACRPQMPSSSGSDSSGESLGQQDAVLEDYLGSDQDPYYEARKAMLRDQLIARDIADPAVLRAMGRVKRHQFVKPGYEAQAYEDHPLPIGEGQTISQPYVVALMTAAVAVQPGDRVLEIGTGSGYQAAVLAELGAIVFSIEIKEALAAFAQANLAQAGYGDVQVEHGDGYHGWEEHAPFAAIVITCAANHISPYWLEQLADGGRLVIPLGDTTTFQTLTLVEKNGEELAVTQITSVSFVPMTGEAMP